MQTFLPLPDIRQSMQALDYRRLGKQRVEARQILSALRWPKIKGGWVNHPATKMWRGYERALTMYGNEAILEWKTRGYRNTMETLPIGSGRVAMPPWFGDEAFHLAHRSNLLRKAPDHYRPLWPDDPDDLEYIWPVE